MKKNNFILFVIIFTGLISRLGVLAINYQNKGNYYGHSLNAADMGLQFVFHRRIGVFDPTHANILHSAAISANKLIDPQNLEFPVSSKENLVDDYENEVGLGTLMGIIWVLTRDMRFIYIQLLQLLIDVFCIFLVFLTAQNIFNLIGISLISAFLYAVFPFQVYMITFPAPYPWMVFGTVIVLYLISKIYRKSVIQISDSKKLKFLFLIGLITGLFSYVRSTFLFLSVFVIFGLLLKEKTLKVIKFAIVIFFAKLFILFPLLIRNYQAFGKVMLRRGVFWHTMYGGLGAHKNPWGIRHCDKAVAQSVLKEYPNIKLYGLEYEEVLKKRFIKCIKEHPFWVLKMFSERILRFLFPVSWTKEGEPYFSIKKTIAVFPLFILAFWGSYLVLLKKYLTGKDLLFFSIPTLYFFIMTVIITSPQIRFVYPGYVFMLILSSFPTWEIYKKILGKKVF